MSTPKLLVALHDVTPVHRDRLERAERLLERAGVTQAAYLLVPYFHHIARADTADFIAWCRASRPFGVQWLLHGYFHDDRLDARAAAEYRPTIVERLAASVMTNREAECATLGPTTLRSRVRAGSAVFQSCVGESPRGFVAPAWLFNRHLLPVLSDLRFDFMESQLRIFDVESGRSLATPVITWATRTRIRRYGSLAVAAASRRLWRGHPVVRIALHPLDFDHSQTVDSITRCLDDLRRTRATMAYDASLFAQ